MKKKKVYFYQFHAPSSKNLLPLAAGLIVSYAKSIPKISDNYDLEIKVLREDPIKMVNSQDNPDVLGFSIYSWNFQQSPLEKMNWKFFLVSILLLIWLYMGWENGHLQICW